MAKKRYVKLEQGRYNISLGRDLANHEAGQRGAECLYCRDYFSNSNKPVNGLSFVCKDCSSRILCR